MPHFSLNRHLPAPALVFLSFPLFSPLILPLLGILVQSVVLVHQLNPLPFGKRAMSGGTPVSPYFQRRSALYIAVTG
jgi:energy-converting hydrogenase Eha subunit F